MEAHGVLPDRRQDEICPGLQRFGVLWMRRQTFGVVGCMPVRSPFRGPIAGGRPSISQSVSVESYRWKKCQR